MMKKILLWFGFFITVWLVGTYIINRMVDVWITNSESIIKEVAEDYQLDSEFINAECVQFILNGMENRGIFYDTILETSDKLWLETDLVLSSILWEQIRISCKGIRWDLKSIIQYSTPTLFRSSNYSVWLAWLKLNTAFQTKKDAIKNWYGDELKNIIITEDVLINNDKINAMIAVYTIKNILYRWGNEWYDISKQPWIVWTLYNLWDKWQPHWEPKVWWAVITVNWNKYVYGEVSIWLYNYLNSKDYMLCKYIDWVLELSFKNSALYVKTLEDKNKYCN